MYFQKHYETKFEPSLCAEPSSKAQADQIAFAKGEQCGTDNEPSGYRPMYYTKSYPQDPKKIEMSFDCSNYQHQFRMGHDAETAPVPYDRHVFQSIFLDKRNRELWTMDEIDERKVIERKWWHQLGHRWQHYMRVVPGKDPDACAIWSLCQIRDDVHQRKEQHIVCWFLDLSGKLLLFDVILSRLTIYRICTSSPASVVRSPLAMSAPWKI